MKELNCYVNEVDTEFCTYSKPELKVKLKHLKGHFQMTCPTENVLFIARTEDTTQILHPSTKYLISQLRQADLKNTYKTIRKVLDDWVTKSCSHQSMLKTPFVFQVTIPDNIVRSHEALMDLGFKESHPILLFVINFIEGITSPQLDSLSTNQQR